ncbi:DNA gyrase subunit A [Telmatospirillum sp.]|uniref:DNA gyrase subunit A n=1 Tax=Telmatospirillum sp. TaxID=2079197 RepID=UPI0028405EF2|nr:DNA gyrase subunit A [Telmatospirillum sp.]MDR3436100.1 DNA gyrase subunit A [Telmatospirillum sp.]
MTTSPTPLPFDITPVTIEEEMRRSYLDYAMSVIVARALPDVRDGLKPVHRRILYSMKESGYDFNKPFRKSARIVGDVMGKYHPHGDSAIYDAMVRMAQDFSMRLELIDGQGNFGSMDGDPPAAMRYTEARLARAATSLLDDIDKETVNFQANYDETTLEPSVLPARFPNLLVNGAGGIAVGMATNIPPHNLGEVIDACCAYIDNPEISIEELMELVVAPDFPTGGVILGRSGIRAAFTTGRGSIILRGRSHFEEIRKDRTAIVVTEMPYQVNKARMIEQMAELVRDKRVEGISDLRDESDRDGVRVVIEIKRDAVPEVVLNQLYRYTPLQSTFGVNMLALNGGRPQMMPLKDIIVAFVAFRDEVITRRTIFELGKARDRAHVLVGLAIAVANLDPVIQLIRAAADPNIAREQLMGRAWPAMDVEPLIILIDEPGHGVVDGHYTLTEIQARAILDLRLHRLTGLEREKIHAELTEIGDQIREFLHILSSRERLYEILRNELVDMKVQFATPRRTTIEENEFEADIEDLIAREDMVVTVTNTGYIKRVPLSEYRTQRRGGKGRSSMNIKEEDFITQVFVANTHTPIVFFSSTGIAYKMKVYRLPLGNPQARGKAMVNLLPLNQDETISTVLPLPEDESTWGDLHVMFATASGYVRRNLLSDFTDIRANGKIAMKLDEGDKLIAVQTCTEDHDILLASHSGKCIRFAVTDVRVFKGRDSTGVRGIRMEEGDAVISMSTLSHVEFDSETRDAYLRGELPTEEQERLAALEQHILSISENGFGKRTSAFEYRITGRGGSGIANMDMTEKTGPVMASFPVEHSDEIMLVTDAGKLIRIPVDGVRIAGRKTQGVMLLRTAEDESVVSVARLGEDVGANGNGGDDDADNGEEVDGEPDNAPSPGDAVDGKDGQGEA